jgi:extracellular factor (EF) 3-hydroxypalmitic acid methyl ester biosynthesis protein
MPKTPNIQSLVTFKNSQGTSARGSILRLSRSTVVFEVYNPYSIVQLSEVLREFSIRRGDRAIYSGSAVVTNLVNTGLMLIVSVNLTDPWKDLVGLLETGLGVRDEVRRFIEEIDSQSAVRPGYQLAVATLRNFLFELVRWLEQVDMDAEVKSDRSRQLSEDIFADISEPIFPWLKNLFQNFEEEALAIPEEELSYHKAYVQRDLHPLLLRVPFVHRTFTKPLGYAGDFEMVNMMQRNQPEGPSTYSQLIHKFYVSSGTCQAHRNRIETMTQLLQGIAKATPPGEQALVLNVGCGPAHEVLNLIREGSLSERLTIELLDFNRDTLDATCQNVRSLSGENDNVPQVEYIQESVNNLLKSAARPQSSRKIRTYDFIYCAGLFDYFSDKVCSRLMSLFSHWAKPRGLIVATNVHPANEYRGVMEHILDWYLIYRNEMQMEELVPAGCERKVYTDATGMNVFVEVQTPPRQS